MVSLLIPMILPAQAQQPPAQPTSPTGFDAAIGCASGQCCPPSTAAKVGIAVGDLAIFLVCFFLFVRLIELRFIQQDRNPLLGRHFGISLSLFLSSLGVAGLYLGVTGCYDPAVWLWAGFVFAIFVVHALYTVVVVRGAA